MPGGGAAPGMLPFVKQEVKEGAIFVVRMLGLTTIYLTVGCLFYMNMETKACESEERLLAEDYDPVSCEEPWTVALLLLSLNEILKTN